MPWKRCSPATESDAPCRGNVALLLRWACSLLWKRCSPATVSVLPTLLLRRCKVNAFCQISSSPNFPLFATIHLYLPPPPTLTPCRSSVIPRQFLRIISPNQPAPFPRAPHSAPSSYRSLPSVPPLLLGNSYVLFPQTNPPHSPAPPIPHPHPTDHSHPSLRCFPAALTYHFPQPTRPIPPRPPFRAHIPPIIPCRSSVIPRQFLRIISP